MILSYPTYKKFTGYHDCAPRALCKIIPELIYDEVYSAFLHSSDVWPSHGVSNKDMNIALDYLNLKDKFEYKEYIEEKPEKQIRHFIRKKNQTFILLIYGHYTVVKGSKILDDIRIFKKYRKIKRLKVYYSWELLL